MADMRILITKVKNGYMAVPENDGEDDDDVAEFDYDRAVVATDTYQLSQLIQIMVDEEFQKPKPKPEEA